MMRFLIVLRFARQYGCRFCLAVATAAMLAGCAAPARVASKNDYTQFRSENPRSILIVPAVNRSIDVDAPNYFLSTISRPLAERGYYVFPVFLVQQVMHDDGLSDADMVHANDPVRLAGIFGADSVLYVSIERWDARYAVFSTTVTVSLVYTLKSGKTGNTLWESRKDVHYSSGQNSSGGLAGLIAQAIVAAIEKASPNYTPLTRQANNSAVYTLGQGLPAGPYDPLYQKDGEHF